MTANDTTEERGIVIGLLVQEDGIYGRLADLAEQEHDTIVSGPPEALELLLVEKEQLIERVILLEAERLASVSRLASEMGAAGPDLSLSDLAALWTADELAQVTDLQASLQGKIGRMAELNKRNASLLRSSLVMLNRWMDVLTGGKESQDTYGRSGNKRRGRGPVAVNRTA